MRILVANMTNETSMSLGKDETDRWMDLAMYQGQPVKKGLKTVVVHVHGSRTRVSVSPVLASILGVSDKSTSPVAAESSSTNVPHQGNRQSPHPPHHNAKSIAAHQRNDDPCDVRGDPHQAALTTSPFGRREFIGNSRSAYLEGVIFHRIFSFLYGLLC